MNSFKDVKNGSTIWCLDPNKEIVKYDVKYISYKDYCREYFVENDKHEVHMFTLYTAQYDDNIKLINMVFPSEEKHIVDKCLVSIDKYMLISHYVDKLRKSLEYEKQVVNHGMQTIKNIENEIEKFESVQS